MANKTETGLKKETAGALSYVLGPITGILILLLEKDEFVRYHAMQSIVVFGGLFVLQWLLGATVVLAFFIPLTTILGFVLWLLLIYKALHGEKYKLPILGEYVDKFLK
jgi:uncharacterized membrane protein